MCMANSVAKSRPELRAWGETDLDGLVDYTCGLQEELRRLRDATVQNSHNSSRPPSTDRTEKPKPKSLRQKSRRARGGQPGHPGRTLPWSHLKTESQTPRASAATAPALAAGSE